MNSSNLTYIFFVLVTVVLLATYAHLFTIKSTPDDSNLNSEIEKGSSHRKFEVSRVKLYRKWPEGK